MKDVSITWSTMRRCLAILAIFLMASLHALPEGMAANPSVLVKYTGDTIPCDATWPYGAGVITIQNRGTHAIYDVNIGYNGSERYYLTDGRPLFPLHYNEISGGDARSRQFFVFLSPESSLQISESTICTTGKSFSGLLQQGDIDWRCNCSDGECMAPGLLIKIVNMNSVPIILKNFNKGPTWGTIYTAVLASGGQAGIEGGSAVVRDMTIPPCGSAYILILMYPLITGTVYPPDAVLAFEGDPLCLSSHLSCRAVSDAGIAIDKSPSSEGFNLSVSFTNRGDAAYILESVVLRRGTNFSPADTEIALWEPQDIIMPGETWESGVVTDNAPGNMPSYNTAQEFSTGFSIDETCLILRSPEPQLKVKVCPVPISPWPPWPPYPIPFPPGPYPFIPGQPNATITPMPVPTLSPALEGNISLPSGQGVHEAISTNYSRPGEAQATPPPVLPILMPALSLIDSIRQDYLCMALIAVLVALALAALKAAKRIK